MSLVTHLSTNCFLVLREQGRPKEAFVLQVVDVFEIDEGGKAYKKISLSDGAYKLDFFLLPMIVQQVETEVKVGSVIKASLSFSQEKGILLMTGFSLEFADCQLLGNPAQETLQGNLQRHSQVMIPQEIVFSQQSKVTKGTIQKEVESSCYIPIKQLDIYTRIFKIKGRVVSRSQIREWENQKGKGKVFTAVLFDGEKSIQLAFYNDMADKFGPEIEQGKIYSVSDAIVKQAGNFNNANNTIELNVTSKTEILECPEQIDIPQKAVDFIKVKEILNVQQNKMVDLVGIVEEVQERQDITTKAGEQKKYQKIIVKDETGSIVVTFWGEDTEKLNVKEGDLVSLTSFLVKDFNGKSLNCTRSSQISFEIPNSEKYQELLHYKRDAVQNISEPQETLEIQMRIFLIGNILQQQQQLLETSGDSSMFFNFIGQMIRVPPQLFYLSCPNDACKKKAEDSGHEQTCMRCGFVFQKPRPRMMCRIKFADESGELDVNCSGDLQCKELFGKTEAEIYELSQRDQVDFLNFQREQLFREFRVKIQGKVNVYNENRNIRYDVKAIKGIDKGLNFYTKQLLGMLDEDNKEQ